MILTTPPDTIHDTDPSATIPMETLLLPIAEEQDEPFRLNDIIEQQAAIIAFLMITGFLAWIVTNIVGLFFRFGIFR